LNTDRADPDIGLDSLRLRAGREDGRRKACLAEVRLPRDVKWLPGPKGVGDAVDMLWDCDAAMSRCGWPKTPTSVSFVVILDGVLLSFSGRNRT